MESLGEKIKYLRNECGLTQEELGKKLFLDKSTIAKYETNDIVPSWEVMKQIAVFFDVSLDYLAGLRDY